MMKYSFEEKKDLLIPVNSNFKPPLDSKGNPLSGDDLLKKMANIAIVFQQKKGRPVPINDQKFVAWLKQAKNLMDSGKTSEEVFRSTLVQSTI